MLMGIKCPECTKKSHKLAKNAKKLGVVRGKLYKFETMTIIQFIKHRWGVNRK